MVILRIRLKILLCAVFLFFIETAINAQTSYDSIVIEYFTANGGEYDRFCIFPKGTQQYGEDENTPSVSVECMENLAVALRKRSGMGTVYTETCQKSFVLKNDLLTNDSTGESYYEKLLSTCMYIMKSDGDIWIAKSNARDSVYDGYAICRISFCGEFSINRQIVITYQFELYESDIFREEFLSLLKILTEVHNIPRSNLIHNHTERKSANKIGG